MKLGVSWCHGSDKSCCARLGDIVSWVLKKTYHQPYEPYRKLGIYESSALIMARWGSDELLSSIWVGITVTFRNKEKIVLKIQSDTAISSQTGKNSDSNYGGWKKHKDPCFYLWSPQERADCLSTWISALLALWWQSRAQRSSRYIAQDAG